jgi:hypothetical protein
MVSWVEKPQNETIMLVEWNVRQVEKEATGIEVPHFEMDVTKVHLSNDCNSTSFGLIIIAQLHILSEVSDAPPWTVADVSGPVDLKNEEVRYIVLLQFWRPTPTSYKLAQRQQQMTGEPTAYTIDRKS